MSQFIPLDTEFFNTKEEKVTNVCSCFFYNNTPFEYWSNSQKQSEIENFKKLKGKIFLCWNVPAEARYIYSLGLNPLDYRWIDLYAEYKNLSNQNDKLMYGKQFDGVKEVMTYRPKPKWQKKNGEDSAGFKQTHSLVEATYKLIGEKRNSEEKDYLRDIIISGDWEKIELHRKEIQEYCKTDTKFLLRMKSEIDKEYARLLDGDFDNLKLLHGEMLERGQYMACVGLMETFGYPVNFDSVMNFSKNAPAILFECRRDINRQFKEKPFKFNPRDFNYSLNTKMVKGWIWNSEHRMTWEKTDTFKSFLASKGVSEVAELESEIKNRINQGRDYSDLNYSKYLSLSLDAFGDKFNYRHSYPEFNFPAQMLRYLKLKQSLNGFTPKEGEDKKSFISYIGSDSKVRCWLNPFGSQTGRNQPPSTSFLFLKPAWQRTLCQPKKGRAMVGFDFKSEEYLIAAVVSNCKSMLKNYKDGDVYLGYGKDIGEIPQDATKESHKKIRDVFKQVTLAMSYLMSKFGLAAELTEKTGHVYTLEQAQEYIDKWDAAYPELKSKQQEVYDTYFGKETTYEDERGNQFTDISSGKYLKLIDGWYLWKDKPEHEFRSVTNFPIQGLGGTILRRAIILAGERGLLSQNCHVNIPLHDALYMEYDSFDLEKIDMLHECMFDAFVSCFPGNEESAKLILLDGFTWSPDYETDSKLTTPSGRVIDCSDKYIDERAIEEYEMYSKYFEHREESDL